MSVRGLEKARGEWSLVTMAWNIKRLHVLRAACGVLRKRPGRLHDTAATWAPRHGLWVPRNALSNPDKTDSAHTVSIDAVRSALSGGAA